MGQGGGQFAHGAEFCRMKELFMDFLQLYGPFSAWGDIAVGGERPTATHPGRSAILGMLAAAAGIRRDEEAKHIALERGYGMSVRMESAGSFLKDYHTTQVPPQVAMKKHPGVTRRDEMMA